MCQLANMTPFYVISQIGIKFGIKKLITDCKVCFTNTLVSFSGLLTILNRKMSNNIYFSANASTF